jgi:hypothetical protein
MLMLPVVFVLLASPVLAQGSGEEEFDVVKAMKEVQRLLRESEALLVKAIAPRKTGDEGGATETAEQARQAIEKLLRDSKTNGDAAADKMKEILEKAPQSGGGGGGGQEHQQPKPGEEQKQKGSEQEVGERDPRNSGDPKDGEKQEGDPESANNKPPESEKDKPARPDPSQEWLGRLPGKIRQAYQNGEWDKIPEKWRKLIQDYTRKMAEIESDR